MKKVKLTISGMHCAACAGNVERSVGKISGVRNVSVSPVTNKGFAECEDRVEDEEIRKAVAKAGYKLINVEKM